MASSQKFRDYVVNQFSGEFSVTTRKMMGEYILYCRGKVIGGIYDDRLLLKPVKSALEMVPEARMELPYDGAKEMLLVEDVDNREFLQKLVEAVCSGLPEPKKKA